MKRLSLIAAIFSIAAAEAATPVTVATPGQKAQTAAHHAGLSVEAVPAAPRAGVPDVRLSAPGAIPPLPEASDWERDGAFRLLCNWSKMSYDDPIVYPGQPGAAHHHTFFGNTAIDASTTVANIRSKGNATCRGGTINLSGYWVPSMIDTATHKAIAPKHLLVYYKTGAWTYFNDGSVIQPLPKGLRIVSGDASRSTPDGAGEFLCMVPSVGENRPGTKGPSIPKSCQPGDEVWSTIRFPQCWDGKNLDSPNHRSHMAFPIAFPSGDPRRQYRCPATHPVVLPQITFEVQYTLPADGDTSRWRLSSDTYDPQLPGGYSSHGDWMNGWDPVISDLWGIECMRKRRNCGSANLGDGRETLEFQGN
jgi:hypothetical protein